MKLEGINLNIVEYIVDIDDVWNDLMVVFSIRNG